MSNFPIVATVLSMILGLSVTRLLLGALTVFRIRRSAAPDWVALVWAVMLFTTQMDFWWAVNTLPQIRATFSFQEFLLLVLLALSLFVSSALMLPSRSEDELEGLRVYFEQDGRYALLFLSGYYLLGFIVNVLLFGVSPMALWGAFDVIMIVIPLCVFAARSRKAYALLTVAFVPINIADLVISLLA
ncbi:MULTISPECIES: hypothetical protein [Pseudomonas]|jgi:hypothetical protein|uniref:Uncharacterized protein n=1 Tax=Pseudomonas putida TaxID=303 RepID=A0A379KP64_PSEPU|nr:MULTISPECIES: hypothetical protein [Pseudomonas]QPN43181.1 hypothetical protein I5S86_16615 [Priestia aryabhattai]KAF1312353.1 hypothetical protein BLX42_03895 [Pseudomonas sp. SG-MS2]MBM7396406.1 hypothetical protein [Pseudomonas sp. M5]NWC79007.1 hypothetical protein [Pseudomonas putida]SUD69340.1 Uncharacterised protein [Pseudomonas putida]